MATTTDKVNMSLDDIIKLNKKDAPKGKGKGTGKRPISAGVKGAATNKRRNSTRTANSSTASNPAAKGVPALVKVAKTVGANTAKRAATINQRRGLNPTGKATKKEVAAAVKRAAAATKPPPTTGLKIRFKPSELPKTTDKIVSEQIKAVLSKQSVGLNRKKTNANNSGSTEKRRQRPKGAPLVVQR